MSETVRVRIPSDTLHEGNTKDFPVFERNRERTIIQVPEEELEEVLRKTGALQEMSE